MLADNEMAPPFFSSPFVAGTEERQNSYDGVMFIMLLLLLLRCYQPLLIGNVGVLDL